MSRKTRIFWRGLRFMSNLKRNTIKLLSFLKLRIEIKFYSQSKNFENRLTMNKLNAILKVTLKFEGRILNSSIRKNERKYWRMLKTTTWSNLSRSLLTWLSKKSIKWKNSRTNTKSTNKLWFERNLNMQN